MSVFLDLFLTGLAAARPPVTGLGEGLFYYATDTGVFSRIVAGAWVTYFTTGGGGSSPWALFGSWTHSSNVPTVSFTGLTGKTEILLIGRAITKTAGDGFQGLVSIDNGATYLTTSGDYVSLNTSGTETNLSSLPIISNTSTAARSFVLSIAPINTTQPKRAKMTNDALDYLIPTANDIDAVQVKLSGAGNMSAGSIYCYAR